MTRDEIAWNEARRIAQCVLPPGAPNARDEMVYQMVRMLVLKTLELEAEIDQLRRELLG